jgi:RNA polymerase sigma-70 factor (ECF subfamily)
VRQLAARANQHVREGRARFVADPGTGRQVTERFLAACATGDYEALLALLAPGATLVGDGGGRVRAPLRPIHGADKVARFLAAVAAAPIPDLEGTVWEHSAGPGFTVTSAGHPLAAVGLELDDDRVAAVYLVVNPDKLRHLSRAP